KRRLIAGCDETFQQVGVGQAATLAPAGNVAEQLNERAQSCLVQVGPPLRVSTRLFRGEMGARAYSENRIFFQAGGFPFPLSPHEERGACQFRRSARPGRSPVCLPSSSTTLPLTRTYTIPSLYWNGLA